MCRQRTTKIHPCRFASTRTPRSYLLRLARVRLVMMTQLCHLLVRLHLLLLVYATEPRRLRWPACFHPAHLHLSISTASLMVRVYFLQVSLFLFQVDCAVWMLQACPLLAACLTTRMTLAPFPVAMLMLTRTSHSSEVRGFVVFTIVTSM